MRGMPPLPQEFGLNPESTRLQVLTEFFDPPTPTKEEKTVTSKSGDLLADDGLTFGAVQMGMGKAFTQELDGDADVVPVAKQWRKLAGRDFLIEEVQMKDIMPALEKLGKPDGAGLLRKTSSVKRLASLQRQLPARPKAAGGTTKTIKQASLT